MTTGTDPQHQAGKASKAGRTTDNRTDDWTDDQRVGVAVVGAGYWGPNLVRNLCACPTADLRWVCDLDVERAQRIVGRYSTVRTTDRFEDVLDDPTVDAVVIATPAGTHAELALAALDSGRHVLVEKPLATSMADGRKLVDVAEARDLVLMCDHTYCYTPAVAEIRRLVHDGVLGDIHYVDAVRINLGLIRPDTDVIWDLAPHDLSILDHILPPGIEPTSVSACGVDPVGAGRACIGYLAMPLTGGGLAHLHVNWLSPTKVRRTIIAGSQRMLVWDDVQPSQRLSIYDSGVDLQEAAEDQRYQAHVAYRTGTIVAPALPETEALAGVVTEFTSAIREHRAPATDGRAGLRVLAALEAAERSLSAGGASISLESATEAERERVGA